MWKPEEDEFFIGYVPPMPPRLARFVSRVVTGIGCLVVIVAVTLASGTSGSRAARSSSATRRVRRHDRRAPYPGLRLDGADSNVEPWLLLVAPASTAQTPSFADSMDASHAHRHAHPRGPLTMIEVEPASLPSKESAAGSVTNCALGSLTRGPSNSQGRSWTRMFPRRDGPGSGKTHKECASLCLRGGIPPALYVRDRAGRSSLLLLDGANW